MTPAAKLLLLELEKLELILTKLEHHPRCHLKKPHECECGLSEGRMRLHNYIQSIRNIVENAKSK